MSSGGGTQDFKWQGRSKDFLGFEIFNSGIFLGKENLASIIFFGWLDLSRVLFGLSRIWRFLIGPRIDPDGVMFLFFMLYKLMVSEKFLRLRNFAWGFLGVSFWSRDIFWFWFFPHSIITVTWNPASSGRKSHLVGDDFCFLSGFKLNFCVSPRGF